MGSPRILRQTGCAGFASAACPHDSAGVREPPSLGEASVVTGQVHGYFFGVWKK